MVFLLYLYACLFILIGIEPVLCVVMASIGTLVLYPTRSDLPIHCFLLFFHGVPLYKYWHDASSHMIGQLLRRPGFAPLCTLLFS